ncbi:MAG TPA: hypothetical protein VEO54_11115 [Thermoanaerobaculia bacterium]|nr:hypothetical protein [Thermoanaerobaculia bacterium]
MRIAIVGNDLRCVALARRLQGEGHDVVVIPGADRMNLEVESIALPRQVPEWKSMRDTEAILAAVAAARAELIVCLHVESADAGTVDRLRVEYPRRVFGTSATAARIETSKAAGIRTARAAGLQVPRSVRIRRRRDAAKRIAASLGEGPVVVKYDGLLGGRGTLFAGTPADCERAIRSLPPGDVIIQSHVRGIELALSLLCTSHGLVPLNVNFEYKRSEDGDRGENTPGMGTTARNIAGLPLPPFLLPLAALLRRIGYAGPLDVSFMYDPETRTPVFLEFTARFGDPELASELLLFEDAGEVLRAVAADDDVRVEPSRQVWAAGVVVRGGSHAAATVQQDSAVCNGVLQSCFSAAARDLRVAIDAVYDSVWAHTSGGSFRTDIGHDTAARWEAYEQLTRDQHVSRGTPAPPRA